jgi:hypothetical protein
MVGALVAGGMVIASFLVGALLDQGGFPALLLVGLPSVLAGAIAFTRPTLRPYATGFLVAWGSTLVIVVVIYALLVAALSGMDA